MSCSRLVLYSSRLPPPCHISIYCFSYWLKMISTWIMPTFSIWPKDRHDTALSCYFIASTRCSRFNILRWGLDMITCYIKNSCIDYSKACWMIYCSIYSKDMKNQKLFNHKTTLFDHHRMLINRDKSSSLTLNRSRLTMQRQLSNVRKHAKKTPLLIGVVRETQHGAGFSEMFVLVSLMYYLFEDILWFEVTHIDKYLCATFNICIGYVS